MDLARLRSIVHQDRTARVSAVPPRRELTYEPVGGDGLPLEGRRELPEVDGAAWAETPYGRVVVVDREFPAEFVHGRIAVGELAMWDPEALAVVNGRPLRSRSGPHVDESREVVGEDLAEDRRRPPLFFDLETTGLSGGAGTVPFVVGCGYLDDRTFRTRQFLLQGFSAERALLHAVTAFLDQVPALVTYNGRTFDLPIMETRWLFHRMPVAVDGVPHLDMLPPSRRLWREAAERVDGSCRLVTLEEALLGVTRVGDVPGIEIPRRYFEYLRDGDARRLEPVLHHNRLDLLSLAALTARAQRLVRGGALAATDVAECVALGRFLEGRGDPAEAERCYRHVSREDGASAPHRERALHALARLLRRRGRFEEAAAVWRALLAHGTGGCSAAGRAALEALAVHHEHRERDLLRARSLAVRALHAEGDPRRRAAVTYRLDRLNRKLARHRGAAPASQPSLLGKDGRDEAARPLRGSGA